MNKTSIAGLKVDDTLFNFINQEVIPGTEIDKDIFWREFSEVVHNLNPKNKELLNTRVSIQNKIDRWHLDNADKKNNYDNYLKFLKDIGYVVETGENFKINTKNVDDEIALTPGPQLVVPVDNARYAINAANARWGSLYDAVYGTDVVDGDKSASYDKARADKVIKFTRNFLNKAIPIDNGNWFDVTEFKIEKKDIVFLKGKKKYFLKNGSQFVGYTGSEVQVSSILFKNNNLHIDININPNSLVGKNDKANISDIIIESALSTIVDNEDSVAAVDADDKVKCYRNWLGLMKGDLEAKFEKNGKLVHRKLNADREYKKTDGSKIFLHGRALLLNRNVGHLMTNPAIILKNGDEIPEGILDAFVSTLCALHDFKITKNSRKKSMYIVKPKMHGPDEVDFANSIFENVEKVLKLEKNTIKVGIMDEERRTTVNLKECIRKVKDRIVFINTGFLDRTGDEMHTSFEAGPMIFKGDMKKSNWLKAYENWNVEVGLDCGFSGKAQIGKGMWAMPDKMKDMMEQKISHPMSGANCAWVPSPTAATLHATHYHEVDVLKKQNELKNSKEAKLQQILDIPVADRPNWQIEEINKELENNAQSILGYVVRWIDQGVGCSKVLDINNIGLMEDRATLRISSQHIANWLHHKVCSKDQVVSVFKKMAKVVDKQNEKDQKYKKMSEDFSKSIAFKTACDLVLEGKTQPSGYTEPLLHERRLKMKSNH